MLKSAKKFDITVSVLGEGWKWWDNTTKIEILNDFFKKKIEEKIILYIDGYDTIFIKDLDTILSKFISFKTDFLMAAESNRWPHNLPEYGFRNMKNRYVNAGGWIGYRKTAERIIWKLQDYRSMNGSEQSLWAQEYIRKPFMLDHASSIFLCLYKTRYIKKDTCILHANGKAIMPKFTRD